MYKQYLYPIYRLTAFKADNFVYFGVTSKYIMVYIVDYSRGWDWGIRPFFGMSVALRYFVGEKFGSFALLYSCSVYMSVVHFSLCLEILLWLRNYLIFSSGFKWRYSTHRYIQRLEIYLNIDWFITIKINVSSMLINFTCHLCRIHFLTLVFMTLDINRPTLVRK